ncbi:MAG: MBL fold metallo-hydrolase [candidate division Zixibacteria bacterium]|nr:MBL fold metallo-hydrolase [candidate division Zixibacteria bacterium]
MTFTILGSASGLPSKNRNCSGAVLQYKGRLLLFDCGSGVTRAFLRAGLRLSDVEYVFISHMHSDHVSDLPYFIQAVKHSGPRGPLTVCLPEEAIAPVSNLLNACYLFPEKIDFGLTIAAHQDKATLYDDEVIVNAIPNKHLEHEINRNIIAESGYPNLMQSYSFAIRAGDRSILYTSDLLSFDDIASHVYDLDLLVIETTHIDLKRLIESIPDRRIGRVVLTHIADEDEKRIKNIVSAYADSAVLSVAEEGQAIIP